MPSKIYQLKTGQDTYTLSINNLQEVTLTHNFPKTSFRGDIPENIVRDINQIIEDKIDCNNKFRQITPQTLPQKAPRLVPPPLSLDEAKSHVSPLPAIAPMNFFQSSQKFISEHKNLFIAASLSGAIGAGIGLTLTYYDQIVSAATITNSLLLGLLAGVVTLIYFFVSEYNKQYQHSSPKN